MRRIISAVLVMAVAMMSLQGCYGRMALTQKVHRLNGQVEDRYVRSFVTWIFVIFHVYTVSALVDFLLFNTIEFWSGDNPIASGEKNFQYSANGETYRVNARKTGDTLTYRISHYRGDTYLDTLTINWDVRNGDSFAMFHSGGKVTEFQARAEKGAVKVTSSIAGEAVPAARMARLYE